MALGEVGRHRRLLVLEVREDRPLQHEVAVAPARHLRPLLVEPAVHLALRRRLELVRVRARLVAAAQPDGLLHARQEAAPEARLRLPDLERFVATVDGRHLEAGAAHARAGARGRVGLRAVTRDALRAQLPEEGFPRGGFQRRRRPRELAITIIVVLVGSLLLADHHDVGVAQAHGRHLAQFAWHLVHSSGTSASSRRAPITHKPAPRRREGV